MATGASSRFSARRYSLLSAQYTRCVPCGEIARAWRPVPAPRGAMLAEDGRGNRRTGCGPGTRADISCQTPRPPRTAAALAVRRNGTARRQVVCAIAALAVAGTAVVSNAPSSIRRAAPMSVKRSFRGFFKHRCSVCRTRAGTSPGSASSAGSRCRICESVSDTSSPSNARRPVSIS
jgi:hypothetical protein